MKTSKKNTQGSILAIFKFLTYSLLLSLTLFVFVVFQPFSYIDNDHSNLMCQGNNVPYETSPNMIFLIDKKLDKLNDSKARKLCQYHIIRDYNNTFETPHTLNYTLLPAESIESSWLSDIFICLIVFLSGSLLIEFTAEKIDTDHKMRMNKLANLLRYLIT